MGYSLGIGEAYIESDYDYVRIEVKKEKHDRAPAYGEPTDFTNGRWPSYSSWAEALRFLSLNRFYDKDDELCLIKEHPGVVLITKSHKEYLDKKYKEFYEKYPVKPGYCDHNGLAKEELKFGCMCPDCDSWPEEKGQAVRLEWLKYWTDWSLGNCDTPIFYNS